MAAGGCSPFDAYGSSLDVVPVGYMKHPPPLILKPTFSFHPLLLATPLEEVSKVFYHVHCPRA